MTVMRSGLTETQLLGSKSQSVQHERLKESRHQGEVDELKRARLGENVIQIENSELLSAKQLKQPQNLDD
jgi:hypothetical protein